MSLEEAQRILNRQPELAKAVEVIVNALIEKNLGHQTQEKLKLFLACLGTAVLSVLSTLLVLAMMNGGTLNFRADGKKALELLNSQANTLQDSAPTPTPIPESTFPNDSVQQ